ncbi:hypothetical protein XENTR_v10010783 [Xenopus tropicalis]|nr:hypothetical protein XENTR_v10010783 [Xenopus tropicalis]
MEKRKWKRLLIPVDSSDSEEEQREKKRFRGSGDEEKKAKKRKKRPRSPEEHPAAGKEKKKSRGEAKTPSPFDINNYRLLKKLGEGTFGKVMLASYVTKNQLVAIKIMSKDGEQDDFKYTRREASVLQLAWRCPFLCKAMATFQTQVQSSEFYWGFSSFCTRHGTNYSI